MEVTVGVHGSGARNYSETLRYHCFIQHYHQAVKELHIHGFNASSRDNWAISWCLEIRQSPPLWHRPAAMSTTPRPRGPERSFGAWNACFQELTTLEWASESLANDTTCRVLAPLNSTGVPSSTGPRRHRPSQLRTGPRATITPSPVWPADQTLRNEHGSRPSPSSTVHIASPYAKSLSGFQRRRFVVWLVLFSTAFFRLLPIHTTESGKATMSPSCSISSMTR